MTDMPGETKKKEGGGGRERPQRQTKNAPQAGNGTVTKPMHTHLVAGPRRTYHEKKSGSVSRPSNPYHTIRSMPSCQRQTNESDSDDRRVTTPWHERLQNSKNNKKHAERSSMSYLRLNT